MARIVADRASAAREASGRKRIAETRRRVRLLRLAGSAALTWLGSALRVVTVEWIVRGSLAETLLFFQQPFRPGWTTVILFALLIVFFDALLGRAYHALLVVAPAVLFLAFVGHQKSYYLGDPLYPTDFL